MSASISWKAATGSGGLRAKLVSLSLFQNAQWAKMLLIAPVVPKSPIQCTSIPTSLCCGIGVCSSYPACTWSKQQAQNK